MSISFMHSQWFRFRLSCLGPLDHLILKMFKFGFQSFGLWEYMKNVIAETRRAHTIRYICAYVQQVVGHLDQRLYSHCQVNKGFLLHQFYCNQI